VEWRPWPLRAGDFDVLEHVNNARSLEAVEDELVRFVPEPRVLRARVEYRGSLERGAEVMLASTFAADGSEGEDLLTVWLAVGGAVRVSATVTVAGRGRGI
jgi:acyl-ACP thioesterase